MRVNIHDAISTLTEWRRVSRPLLRFTIPRLKSTLHCFEAYFLICMLRMRRGRPPTLCRFQLGLVSRARHRRGEQVVPC